MTMLLHTFVGGTAGMWSVEDMRVIVGQALPSVLRVSIYEGHQTTTPVGVSGFCAVSPVTNATCTRRSGPR